MRRDPIELDPTYRSLLEQIDQQVEMDLAAQGHQATEPGYCYRFWEAKKQLLYWDYNIQWQSPAELNPHIKFD